MTWRKRHPSQRRRSGWVHEQKKVALLLPGQRKQGAGLAWAVSIIEDTRLTPFLAPLLPCYLPCPAILSLFIPATSFSRPSFLPSPSIRLSQRFPAVFPPLPAVLPAPAAGTATLRVLGANNSVFSFHSIAFSVVSLPFQFVIVVFLPNEPS